MEMSSNGCFPGNNIYPAPFIENIDLCWRWSISQNSSDQRLVGPKSATVTLGPVLTNLGPHGKKDGKSLSSGDLFRPFQWLEMQETLNAKRMPH